MKFLILAMMLLGTSAFAKPTTRFVFSCEKKVYAKKTGVTQTTVIGRTDPEDLGSPFPESEKTDRFYVEMIGGNSAGPSSFSLCDRVLDFCTVSIGKKNMESAAILSKEYEVSLSCSVWNPPQL